MTAAGIHFVVGGKPSADDAADISDGLSAHAVAAGISPAHVSVMARTDDALCGGLTGMIFGVVCLIKLLWVSDAARGQGIGRRLMDMAEDEARRNSCTRMQVDTMSYQASGFYQSLGYLQTAMLPNFFDGHDRIFFEKLLSGELA